MERLSHIGVSGIEVAPAKIAGGWAKLDNSVMSSFKRECTTLGLEIPSFQAFLFGKPELQLLGDSKTFNLMKDHFKFVCELASIAGAKVLVFGAPRNRLLMGYDFSDGSALATERLSVLADICWEFELSIGLEAVPKHYGGEIIQSYRESLDIVKLVNNPGLVFHLDTGCTYLNNDSISKAIYDSSSLIGHFHISQPELSNFASPVGYHSDAASALKEVDYNGWKCIEMREGESPLRALEESIKFVRETYY